MIFRHLFVIREDTMKTIDQLFYISHLTNIIDISSISPIVFLFGLQSTIIRRFVSLHSYAISNTTYFTSRLYLGYRATDLPGTR